MKELSSSPTWVHIVGGGVAGPIATVVCQPFDVVKTQMIGKDVKTSSGNILSTAKHLYNIDGAATFWRGSIPTLFRVLPGAAINFGMIHTLKTQLPRLNSEHQLSSTQNFLIGGLSRATASIALCPFTVIKTRFEFAKVAPDATVLGTLVNIFQKEGIKGLYSGLSATLARDIPHAGIYYVLYSKCKIFFAAKLQAPETSSKVTLTSGALAAIFSTMATHPFEVVRTRTQLDVLHQKSSVMSSLRSILQTEGIATLFRGVLPRILKRSISSSISWTIYESIVTLFEGDNSVSIRPTAKFDL